MNTKAQELQTTNEQLEERIAALETENTRLQQRLHHVESGKQEQEELLQLVIKHNPNAIAVFDNNLHYMAVSDRYVSDYHIEGRPVIGLHHYEVFPEIPQRWRDIHQRSLEGAVERSDEDSFVREDGSVDYNRWECRPWYDIQGNIGGIITFTEVITERKNMELQLRESENRYRTLIENQQDGIFVIQGGKMTFANEQFAAIVDYPREELEQRSIVELIAPEDREWVLERYARRQKGENVPNTYEFRMIKQDGVTRVWVNMVVTTIEYEGAVASMGTVRDITERKQSEEALRTSEARQRALLDAIPDMMFIQDREGTFLDYRAPQDALMLPPEQFLGKRDSDIFSPELTQRFLDAITQALDTGTLQLVEYSLPIDDQPHFYEARISPIDAAKVMVLVRDVTDKKQAQEEYAALQQQIIEVQRAALQELSAPLLPISESVLVLPLIGSIDSRRAQQVMETLLEGVATYRADVAIVDITGVQVVDTQVANALIQAAQAVQLLGAQVVLTGIGPTMAQTLVSLGADLSSIVTRGNLQSGIAYATR
jgi:rsbT co-antagonist protein RsbR